MSFLGRSTADAAPMPVELLIMLQESLYVARSRGRCDIPLLLPANRKAAKVRIIPKISCDSIVLIFPWEGSGRWIVSREPEAVTICCSFVPANCPRMACVIEVGGCMVSEYMNILEVAAIVDH